MGEPTTMIAQAHAASERDIVCLEASTFDGEDRGGLATALACARRLVDQSGAVVLRGFGVADADALRSASRAFGAQTIAYDERTTRRRAVGDHVYGTTEHPSRLEILPHNENAYAASWPAWLLLCCDRPAAAGGETPLYDGRRVLETLDPALVDELSQRGVLHVRNFGGGLGLGLEEAYGTSDRSIVEARLAATGMDAEWRADGTLRTRWRTRPVLVHPRTSQRAFFSHVAFFHQSALPVEVRDDLLAACGPEGLPNNTFFGDGAPIPETTIAAILAAYRRFERCFAWQRGDLLVVDNQSCAHGRRPYSGQRRILVTLCDAVQRSEARFG